MLTPRRLLPLLLLLGVSVPAVALAKAMPYAKAGTFYVTVALVGDLPEAVAELSILPLLKSAAVDV